MEPIVILRSQVIVTGGPIGKEKWLVDVTQVNDREFFCVDKSDRKFRKWIGERPSGSENTCDLVDVLTQMRAKEEDRLVQAMKEEADPAPSAPCSQSGKPRGYARNRPREIQGIPEIIDIEYPAFSFTTEVGALVERPAKRISMLRSKQNRVTKVFLEMTADNLLFLHEAAQDPARWSGGCPSEEDIPATLPPPRTSNIKWRTYPHQKPALVIVFKDANGQKRSKMKTPSLTGDPALDGELCAATEAALQKHAESVIGLQQNSLDGR